MTKEIDLQKWLKEEEYHVWEIYDNFGIESGRDAVQRQAFVNLANMRKRNAELEEALKKVKRVYTQRIRKYIIEGVLDD